MMAQNTDHKLQKGKYLPTKSRHPDPREMAEIVAIQALNFIAGEPERLGRFLAETGLGPQSLRAAAQDPAFLSGVLEFVLRDEKLILAFAEATELGPETVSAAHIALNGAPSAHNEP
jgi:hypothetical protein